MMAKLVQNKFHFPKGLQYSYNSMQENFLSFFCVVKQNLFMDDLTF